VVDGHDLGRRVAVVAHVHSPLAPLLIELLAASAALGRLFERPSLQSRPRQLERELAAEVFPQILDHAEVLLEFLPRLGAEELGDLKAQL
jgi:hypothetical protein